MSLATKLLLFTCGAAVVGQQFAGQTIANSLTSVSGAEIAYWKMTDSSGNSFTLTNYFSQDGNGQRLETTDVQRVVIALPGLLRDPYNYASDTMKALAAVPDSYGIDATNTQIVSPYYPNQDDAGVGYPADGSSDALVWAWNTWFIGGNNNGGSISSYDTIEKMIQYFADRTRYPNVHQVVVAGHSLGAMMVQHYAAVAPSPAALGLPDDLRVTYWVGNPNSYLWFNSTRPFYTANCPTNDDWYNGLANYNNSYSSGLAAEGIASMRANYETKSIAYARGLRDQGDASLDCGPWTTGMTRWERFFQFISYFPVSCSSGATDAGCDTVDYINAGHNYLDMASSPAGQRRLFIDNFSGDLSRSVDFGCPRWQTGDDPLPDSTCTTAQWAPPQGPVNGYTYYGCWTDQTPRDLEVLAYDDDTNSLEKCTSTCAARGYAFAALEYATQCYCGNTKSPDPYRALDTGCVADKWRCPGNKDEFCGAQDRTILYYNGA